MAKPSFLDPEIQEVSSNDTNGYALEALNNDGLYHKKGSVTTDSRGVAEIQGIQAVWGKYGKYLVWAG